MNKKYNKYIVLTVLLLLITARKKVMANVTDIIKKFEGFAPKAFFDYKQYTNGYGTKALAPGEVITKKVAEQRLNAEISRIKQIIDSSGVTLTENKKAALISFAFNVGTKPLNLFLERIKKGWSDQQITERLSMYNKAGGKVNAGLVARRAAEVKLYLS